MQEKIIVFKFNEDGSEERVPGSFNSDKEAVAALPVAGDYIFYKVLSVTKADVTKAKGNE